MATTAVIDEFDDDVVPAQASVQITLLVMQLDGYLLGLGCQLGDRLIIWRAREQHFIYKQSTKLHGVLTAFKFPRRNFGYDFKEPAPVVGAQAVASRVFCAQVTHVNRPALGFDFILRAPGS